MHKEQMKEHYWHLIKGKHEEQILKKSHFWHSTIKTWKINQSDKQTKIPPWVFKEKIASTTIAFDILLVIITTTLLLKK